MNSQNIKNPRIYTLSAIIIGYALIGKYNATEQNALANWFLLIGQVLETNSGFLQLINSNNKNNNSNNCSNNKANIMNNLSQNCFIPSEEELDEIKEMLNFINSKIDELSEKNRK